MIVDPFASDPKTVPLESPLEFYRYLESLQGFRSLLVLTGYQDSYISHQFLNTFVITMKDSSGEIALHARRKFPGDCG